LAALLGRERGHAAEDVRELGLAPEVADAGLLERGGGLGAADRRFGLGFQLADAVDHARGILVSS
jgi:hypothetical protein